MNQNDKWPAYGAEYRHADGSAYVFTFFARDDDDARQRLRSIRGNAELLGRVEATIPASLPAAGLWVRLRCYLGNLLR